MMAALADKHAYAIELEQKVRLQREYAKDLEHAVSTGGQEVISCASPASFFFVMLMLPLLPFQDQLRSDAEASGMSGDRPMCLCLQCCS